MQFLDKIKDNILERRAVIVMGKMRGSPAWLTWTAAIIGFRASLVLVLIIGAPVTFVVEVSRSVYEVTCELWREVRRICSYIREGK